MTKILIDVATVKLVLEALEHLQPTALTSFYTIGDRDKAITALREALAKPDFWEGYVPEPVKPAQQALDKMAENARELGLDYAPIQQEPVAFFDPQSKGFYWAKPTKVIPPVTVDVEPLPLYTTPQPAQRTWVGLTDEEIWETVSRIGTSDSDVNPYAKLADARAIEAKLRSKNEDRS